MKTTIRDVARKAGVSIGTVSRVINGHAAVSESSRSRVDNVVRSLNYYPLRKRRSPQGGNILNGKRVAFFILGFDRSLSSSPVVAEVIHGVEAALAEGGATVELVDLPRMDQLPVVLKQDYLDGSILFGALQGNLVEAAKPQLIKRLSSLPSVWILRRPNHCWGDSVGPNDWLIGKMAFEHLVSKGHRRLAFLNPRREQIIWQMRGISMAHYAQSAGVEVKSYLSNDGEGESYPLKRDHDLSTIERLVDEMLAETPRPTAVFTPADSIAIYVYRALAVRGLEVGKDLSLISCNHEAPLTDALHPILTTLDIHSELIGQKAVEQLALRWRGESASKTDVEISLEPSLVEGESVATLA
jgi:LacI family transcriptional regulator